MTEVGHEEMRAGGLTSKRGDLGPLWVSIPAISGIIRRNSVTFKILPTKPISGKRKAADTIWARRTSLFRIAAARVLPNSRRKVENRTVVGPNAESMMSGPVSECAI